MGIGPRGVLALAIPALLAAQESRFDARSRLVQVPVTVTGLDGRGVDGLQAPDFLLLDNRQPRKIAVDTIDTGLAPLAVVMAVQSSGISAAALEKVQKLGAMIPAMVTGERGCTGLVGFADRATWLLECSPDADKLRRALYELRPLSRPGEDKQACMLDAVTTAVAHLRARPNSRRVLLLISESRDRGSETELQDAVVAAQSAGVTVYAATYSAFKTAWTSKLPVIQPRRALKRPTPNDTMGTVDGQPSTKVKMRRLPPEQSVDVLAGIGELRRLSMDNTVEVLAAATGGAVFPFTKQKALEEAMLKLGTELHSQYVLSFDPEAAAPGYHALEVRLARGGEYRLRARPGYWAAEEAAGQRR